MYRSDLGTRDKSGALAVVVAVHAGLLFMLLQLSGKIDLTDPQSVLKTFDVTDPPPPPRTIPPPPRPADKAKPKQKEGGSSPKNIKSEATPVTAPKPRVAPLIPNPVVVAETPRQGAQSTQGASDVRGPGTGLGRVRHRDRQRQWRQWSGRRRRRRGRGSSGADPRHYLARLSDRHPPVVAARRGRVPAPSDRGQWPA